MMRGLFLCALLGLTAAAGCNRCKDLHARPIEGKYELVTQADAGVPLGELQLTSAALDTSADQVVLTYTTVEGVQLRATYHVKQKRKTR